jgi:hypothetical protein
MNALVRAAAAALALGAFVHAGASELRHIASEEGHRSVRGEASGVVDHPFEAVERALAQEASWCEILVLPFNVKRCVQAPGATLTLYLSPKAEGTIEHAYRLDLRFTPGEAGEGELSRLLQAKAGPFDTHDYAIVLDARMVDSTHTAIRLSYSYAYGTVGRIAQQAYLSGAGAGKVGFTTLDEAGDLVGGLRGVIERNTVRYFLAIVAYLDTGSAPASQRLDARLNAWFDWTERYPRQLREMDRETYLVMKRGEAGLGMAE